ncbi:hypothetical protein M5K25_010439 [Dendrobium thyrsiflorum]|uniref:RNase H type-1 domain-containing protein n=1 Tax=Dendrobium thyrsiflorum TaxID=117978 RepID=A0ABD0V083_DENTH
MLETRGQKRRSMERSNSGADGKLAVPKEKPQPVFGVYKAKEDGDRKDWSGHQNASQKASSKFLCDGDRNTKFFHAMIKKKRVINHIYKITTSEGINYESEDMIIKTGLDYFQSLFNNNVNTLPVNKQYLIPRVLLMISLSFPMLRSITSKYYLDFYPLLKKLVVYLLVRIKVVLLRIQEEDWILFKDFDPLLNIIVRWSLPNSPYCKLNSNGSMKDDAAGGGGIVRNHLGNVLVAYAIPLHTTNVPNVELLALLYGLNVCMRFGISKVWIEVDVMLVIYLINRKNFDNPNNFYILKNIKNLLCKLDFKISHIHREANVAADFLANLGRNSSNDIEFSADNLPFLLKGIVKLDKSGCFCGLVALVVLGLIERLSFQVFWVAGSIGHLGRELEEVDAFIDQIVPWRLRMLASTLLSGRELEFSLRILARGQFRGNLGASIAATIWFLIILPCALLYSISFQLSVSSALCCFVVLSFAVVCEMTAPSSSNPWMAVNEDATAAVSRQSVARVLVEMDISKKHPKDVWIGSELNGYQ